MDDDAITEPVPMAGNDLVVWSEDGRLLVNGDSHAVDVFIEQLAPDRTMRVDSIKPIADVMEVVAAASGRVRRGSDKKVYVEMSANKLDLLDRQGVITKSGARLSIVRGPKGRFTEQVPFQSAPRVNPAMANPQTMVALAALRMAIEELQESVDAIAADVSDLRRIAETVEIGNIAGLYRVLANARAQVDATGMLPQATWDSIAPHEVTVQQAADRLRALLRRTVEDLPLAEDSGERYDAARRLLDQGTVSRSLRLLVLAEQCRLLWRSLKLEQIRRIEPYALPGEAEAAKAMLAENASADQALIGTLHDAFARLGKVSAIDGARLNLRGKLPAAAGELREQVNHFAALRAQQLESWAPDPTPTIRDAARYLGVEGRKMAELAAIGGKKFAGIAATEGRKKVGGLLEGLGKRLKEDSSKPDREA